MQEEELIEPHTLYLAWKIIMARSEIVVMHQGFKVMEKKLFDFLLKVNSILDKDDSLVSGKFASLYCEHLFWIIIKIILCHSFIVRTRLF